MIVNSFIVYEINCKLNLRESKKKCTCLQEITDKENMFAICCNIRVYLKQHIENKCIFN